MGYTLLLPSCLTGQLATSGMMSPLATGSYSQSCTQGNQGSYTQLTFHDTTSYGTFVHQLTTASVGRLIDTDNNPYNQQAQVFLPEAQFQNLVTQLQTQPANGELALSDVQNQALSLVQGDADNMSGAQAAGQLEASGLHVWDQSGTFGNNSLLLSASGHHSALEQITAQSETYATEVAEPPQSATDLTPLLSGTGLIVSLLTLLAIVALVPRLNAYFRVRKDREFDASPEGLRLAQEKAIHARTIALKAYENTPVEELIEKFTTDMVAEQRTLLTSGNTPTIYGRVKETRDVFDNLIMAGRTGIAITGPAGVGKTTLVKALARSAAKISSGMANGLPAAAGKMRFLRVDFGKLLAGASRDDFEYRLAPIRRIAKSDPDHIKLVIEVPDNPEDVERFRSVLETIKDDISQGQFGVILVMTRGRYNELIGKSNALVRRIDEYTISESGIEDRDIEEIILEHINAQIDRIALDDPAMNNVKFTLTNDAFRRIREAARVTEPYSLFADPARSIKLAQRLTAFVYRNLNSEDNEVIINEFYVDRFVRQLPNVEIRRLLAQIDERLNQATSRMFQHNPLRALGEDPSSLEQRNRETLVDYGWRLRNILRSLEQLLSLLNDINSSREDVDKALTTVQTAYDDRRSTPQATPLASV